MTTVTARYYLAREIVDVDKAQWAKSPSTYVASSATVEPRGAHDIVHVWSRGGLAGQLIVGEGDGARLAEALGLQDVGELPLPKRTPDDELLVLVRYGLATLGVLNSTLVRLGLDKRATLVLHPEHVGAVDVRDAEIGVVSSLSSDEQWSLFVEQARRITRERDDAPAAVSNEDEHRERHKLLHRHLDEIVADWLVQTRRLPSKSSVMDLLTWSAAQTRDPSTPADAAPPTPTPRAEPATIDKSTWGDGPWQDEPDVDAWRDEATGLECGMFRHPDVGTWTGHVFLPPTHPLYGLTRSDIWRHDIYVHGGVTWLERADSVYSVPVPVGADWQAVGFHCAHAGDYQPGFDARLRAAIGGRVDGGEVAVVGGNVETYRDHAYARANVRLLAQQLANAAAAMERKQ